MELSVDLVAQLKSKLSLISFVLNYCITIATNLVSINCFLPEENLFNLMPWKMVFNMGLKCCCFIIFGTVIIMAKLIKNICAHINFMVKKLCYLNFVICVRNNIETIYCPNY